MVTSLLEFWQHDRYSIPSYYCPTELPNSRSPVRETCAFGNALPIVFVLIQYPTQSHYYDTGLNNLCPIVLMPNVRFGSDKYRFYKSFRPNGLRGRNTCGHWSSIPNATLGQTIRTPGSCNCSFSPFSAQAWGLRVRSPITHIQSIKSLHNNNICINALYHGYIIVTLSLSLHGWLSI